MPSHDPTPSTPFRPLALLAGALIGLGICQPLAASQTPGSAPHWSYEGNESPLHWGELSEEYAECDRGKNQSPVDFEAAEHTSGGTVRHHYAPARYTLNNNGHTVQAVPAPPGMPDQGLQIGRKHFMLKQFHFHTPSEHTFRGRHFPMEVHFVHESADGELAVLGVVFRDGEENPALTPLLAQALPPGKSRQLKAPLDIGPLLPENPLHFRLSGSLTTPPCSEGVNWIVFETPVRASRAQIDAMHRMIGHDNARPVQPLNSRIVIEEDQ